MCARVYDASFCVQVTSVHSSEKQGINRKF